MQKMTKRVAFPPKSDSGPRKGDSSESVAKGKYRFALASTREELG